MIIIRAQIYRIDIMHLPNTGLYQRDLYVLQTVITKGIPVATVIGGGYSRDIDRLAQRHSIIHRAASKVRQQKWMAIKREDGQTARDAVPFRVLTLLL